jgi:SAM-dependent methyltransferase
MSRLKSFPKSDIELNTRMYDLYINKLNMQNGWAPKNQVDNFKSLLRLPDMAGVSLKNAAVLDVGCGTGDFVPLLRKKKISRYVGIDIYKPSLERAREAHPDEIFIEGDLLSNAVTEVFDYAFCSGAMTIKTSVDNYDFLDAMITKMWELTRVGLAFNVLTDDDSDPDHDLFFYNPEKVLEICHSIDPTAILGAEKTEYVSQIHVYMYRDTSKGQSTKSKGILNKKLRTKD